MSAKSVSRNGLYLIEIESFQNLERGRIQEHRNQVGMKRLVNCLVEYAAVRWRFGRQAVIALVLLTLVFNGTVLALQASAGSVVAFREPTPKGAPLHDCMLVFRFGNDPGLTPPLGSSEAKDLNDSGQIAGWVMAPDQTVHAVRWEPNGTTTQLGALGGRNSCALGINASGAVVGWAETATGEAHAFVWKDGVMTDLGEGRSDLTSAYAINDDGDVVGMSWPSAAVPGSPMGRAVAWMNGQMTDLATCLAVPCSSGQDINNGDLVVGWSVGDEFAQHAYVWDGLTRTDLGADLPGASQARAINEIGATVGWFETSDKVRHAALWIHGELTDLGVAERSSVANDINDSGVVVGAVSAPSGDLLPVRWDPSGPVSLGTLGGRHGEAFALNREGDIVGWSEGADAVPRAFLWRNGHMTALSSAM